MAPSPEQLAQRPAESDRKLFPEERREAIVALLSAQPKVLVSELSHRFGVSAFTVRADLDLLEQEGRLRRCHGGALSLSKATTGVGYARRQKTASESKQAIGATAARLVESGDSLFLDTGTTTIEMVPHLAHVDDLTILTNDFAIASRVEEVLAHAKLFFLGGFVRMGYRYTYGQTPLDTVRRFHVDKAFLSTNGFTVEDGFTCESLDQAQIKEAYAARATERIVMFDVSKVGSVFFSTFLDVGHTDVMVTDAPLDEGVIAACERRNANIEFVHAERGREMRM